MRPRARNGVEQHRRHGGAHDHVQTGTRRAAAGLNKGAQAGKRNVFGETALRVRATATDSLALGGASAHESNHKIS